MAERTHRGRARNVSERAYTMALRATAAFVVLLIFATPAHFVSLERIDGGVLLPYAGVIPGYILDAPW